MDSEASQDPPKPPKPLRGTPREERLKAALKANIGRRKAQARQRATAGGDAAPDDAAPDADDHDDTDTNDKNQ